MAADETTPSSSTTTVKAEVDTVSFDNANKILVNLGTSIKGAEAAFEMLGKKAGAAFDTMLKTSGLVLKELDSLTANQSKAFGLLTTGIFGASEAFKSFADTRQLNTFTSQLGGVVDVLAKVGDTTGLKSIGEKLGFTGPIEGLKSFLVAQSQSADAASEQREGLIQLAAATGGLGKLYNDLGPGLSNTSNLLRDNANYMADVGNKTGLTSTQVSAYYKELGQIPKQLNELVSTGSSATAQTTAFEAALTLSRGTGRDFHSVVQDIGTAFENYDLKGQGALEYVAKMTEVSNNLGIKLDLVRKYMNETSNSFKEFGNVGSSSAVVFNDLVGRLQKTGTSTGAAVEIVSNFTSKIKDLSIAQRAFLSAQSGGPGGLQGAYQIEKLIRDNKLDEVSKLIENQLKKQIGSITTVDEAVGSQDAAAKLTRQNAIMRSGEFGNLFKNDAEAEDFAKALRDGKGGKALEQNTLKAPLEAGNNLQKESVTVLHQILNELERSRVNSGIANHDLFRDAFSANSTTNKELATSLDSFRSDNLGRSMKANDSFNKGNRSSNIEEYTRDSISNLSQVFGKSIPEGFKGLLTETGKILGKGTEDQRNSFIKNHIKDFEQKADNALNDKTLTKQQQQDEYNKYTSQKMQYANYAANALDLSDESKYSDLSDKTGLNVGQLKYTRAQQQENQNTGMSARVSGATNNQHVSVDIRGICINCGSKMHTNPHNLVTNPTKPHGQHSEFHQ